MPSSAFKSAMMTAALDMPGMAKTQIGRWIWVAFSAMLKQLPPAVIAAAGKPPRIPRGRGGARAARQ
jgi:hypothetical protein